LSGEAAVCGDALHEGLALLELQVEVVGEDVPWAGGNSGDAAASELLAEGDELFGVSDGEGLEHEAVDEGEDGGVGANPESEREDGDGGEAGTLGHHAEAEADVVEDAFGGGFPGGGVDFFFDGFGAAHFDARCALGFLRGESAAEFLFGGGFLKCLELFVEVVASLFFVEERFGSVDEVSQQGHGGSF